ncbi:hypothetical protein [Pseudomonas sp. NA-150]|uniref:hypothetical protein n=1 Tax=Pseudomonas sp. NA-150 TaxID=3367525 RepID=UPI0037C81080
MQVKNLRATSGGKDRIVGMWRHAQDGIFSGLYQIATDARNHVSGLQIAAMNFNSDTRLSAEAKKDDIKSAAKDRLYFLGQLQRKLDEVRAIHKTQAARLTSVTPYRDGDSIAVQIDLALAAQLRAMTPSERTSHLLMGTTKAYVDAMLRLPRELSGVSPDWYARVQKEALIRANPREAQEFEDLYQAAEDAQDTIHRAFQLIGKDSGISLDDQVGAAGDSANDLVTGVHPGTVDRIKERLDAIEKEEAEQEAEAIKQIQGAA